jgi:hypothetical protein
MNERDLFQVVGFISFQKIMICILYKLNYYCTFKNKTICQNVCQDQNKEFTLKHVSMYIDKSFIST